MAPDPTSVERPRQRNNGGRDSLDREKSQLVSSYGESYVSLGSTRGPRLRGCSQHFFYAIKKPKERLWNEVDAFAVSFWQKGSFSKFFLCTDSPTFAVKIKTQRKAKIAPSI